MQAGTAISGVDDLQRRLALLQSPESQKAIALSVTYSGLGVIERACRNAAPGSIKQEVGKYVRVSGDRVWGRAGLIKFPRPGDGQNGPHGVYVDLGTKFITPRRFTENAISGATSTAIQAMKHAAARKIDKILNGQS